MIVFLTLVAVAAVTWLFRVSFTAIVSANRLPAAVRARMDAVSPAAFAALLATEIAGAGPGTLGPMLLAVAAAALAARRTGNHVVAIGAAVAAWSLASLW